MKKNLLIGQKPTKLSWNKLGELKLSEQNSMKGKLRGRDKKKRT